MYASLIFHIFLMSAYNHNLKFYSVISIRRRKQSPKLALGERERERERKRKFTNGRQAVAELRPFFPSKYTTAERTENPHVAIERSYRVFCLPATLITHVKDRAHVLHVHQVSFPLYVGTWRAVVTVTVLVIRWLS